MAPKMAHKPINRKKIPELIKFEFKKDNKDYFMDNRTKY